MNLNHTPEETSHWNQRLKLHTAHILAMRAAGARLRAVAWWSDTLEVCALPLCARARKCAHCAAQLRLMARTLGPYLEMGLIHEVPPATSPGEAEPLADGAHP